MTEAKEGAPKLETPEDKGDTPLEDAPRDEEAPLETPEEPQRDYWEALARTGELGAWGPEEEVEEAEAPEAPADELTELRRHVSSHPVDAHAPAWEGREPNSP